jgi:hypothetical protein
MRIASCRGWVLLVLLGALVVGMVGCTNSNGPVTTPPSTKESTEPEKIGTLPKRDPG